MPTWITCSTSDGEHNETKPGSNEHIAFRGLLFGSHITLHDQVFPIRKYMLPPLSRTVSPGWMLLMMTKSKGALRNPSYNWRLWNAQEFHSVAFSSRSRSNRMPLFVMPLRAKWKIPVFHLSDVNNRALLHQPILRINNPAATTDNDEDNDDAELKKSLCECLARFTASSHIQARRLTEIWFWGK